MNKIFCFYVKIFGTGALQSHSLFESKVKTRQSYGSDSVVEKEKGIMPGTRLEWRGTTAYSKESKIGIQQKPYWGVFDLL